MTHSFPTRRSSDLFCHSSPLHRLAADVDCVITQKLDFHQVLTRLIHPARIAFDPFHGGCQPTDDTGSLHAGWQPFLASALHLCMPPPVDRGSIVCKGCLEECKDRKSTRLNYRH